MKYFCISDIHSCYTAMINGLNEAGFDKNNPNHTLIVCGDVFDRGNETKEVYNYLKSLKRLVLVKGNHESLYLDLLKKKFPENYDFHNGTVRTFCNIAGYNEECLNGNNYYYLDPAIVSSSYIDWKQIQDLVKNSPITRWIKSKKWLDYFEIGNYICVHSFIPTAAKKEVVNSFGIYFSSNNPEYFEYDPNWRNSKYWEEARWGCPYEQYRLGQFKPEEKAGKTLICGHWHTSSFFKVLDNKKDVVGCPLYVSKGIIGLDACTILYDKVNVFTFEV